VLSKCNKINFRSVTYWTQYPKINIRQCCREVIASNVSVVLANGADNKDDWHKQLERLAIWDDAVYVSLQALVMEPPNVQTDSMIVHVGFPIVNVGVDRTGVVGLKVMNLSHSECQFARTSCIALSSS
jgi:hypothetical protein